MFGICVIENYWLYVGEIEVTDDCVTIRDAKSALMTEYWEEQDLDDCKQVYLNDDFGVVLEELAHDEKFKEAVKTLMYSAKSADTLNLHSLVHNKAEELARKSIEGMKP